MQMMLQDADIRPISDLRNRFSEVSDAVRNGKTIIFTKNGYGCIVTMSFDAYKLFSNPMANELRHVDALCETDVRHFTREESLSILRECANARRKRLQA